MTWQVIDAKWEGIREAFARFDPAQVAEFGPDDVQRLMNDSRIVRSRSKIEATIDNAAAMLELEAEHGSFRRYLDSLGDFEATVADLKRQFRFIGDSGAYRFLYVVDEPVPSHEEWFARRPKRRGTGRGERRARRTPAASPRRS